MQLVTAIRDVAQKPRDCRYLVVDVARLITERRSGSDMIDQ
jgi:hypothetical protein